MSQHYAAIPKGLQMVPRAAAAGARAAGAVVCVAAAGSCCRSVIEFKNFTDAISKLSISDVVFDSRNICDSNSVIATPNPDAGLFIATEMAAASRLAFSARFAVATALKALIRPLMGPTKPLSRPTLASDDR